jgi:hypothetical protein
VTLRSRVQVVLDFPTTLLALNVDAIHNCDIVCEFKIVILLAIIDLYIFAHRDLKTLQVGTGGE